MFLPHSIYEEEPRPRYVDAKLASTGAISGDAPDGAIIDAVMGGVVVFTTIHTISSLWDLGQFRFVI